MTDARVRGRCKTCRVPIRTDTGYCYRHRRRCPGCGATVTRGEYCPGCAAELKLIRDALRLLSRPVPRTPRALTRVCRVLTGGAP